MLPPLKSLHNIPKTSLEYPQTIPKVTQEEADDEEESEEEYVEEDVGGPEELEESEAEQLQPSDELVERSEESEAELLQPADELVERPEGEMYREDESAMGMGEEATLQDKVAMEDMSPAERYSEQGRYFGGVNCSVPRVDLLANLIRWIASARAEIGTEQFATFLEVYGISGHLTQEFKEVILHLAETAETPPPGSSSADTWSRLMLELHGILTGGEGPLHPVKPVWLESAGKLSPVEPEPKVQAVKEKPKETPLKLKLVVTGADGSDREICLNLSPEEGK